MRNGPGKDAQRGAPDRSRRPKATNILAVARERSNGGQPSSEREASHVPLTARHETILRVLGRRPQTCMTVIEISGNGPIRNREAAGLLLRDLEKLRLVCRPFGKRRGYALTPSGLARLRAC